MAFYDSGVLYDSGVVYDEGIAAPSEKKKHMAKVKLNLASLTPEETIQFANDVKTAMTGNANFATPTPTLPVLMRLTNPTNPVTGSINTYATTSANPSERLDYIFPCALLASNISSAQVFRTDRLNPVPPNLNSNDCKVASDHLPVLMVFNNPYASAPVTNTAPVYSFIYFAVTNQVATFKWQTVSNRYYNLERSVDLSNWTTFKANLLAAGTNFTVTTNAPFGANFFRVYRLP